MGNRTAKTRSTHTYTQTCSICILLYIYVYVRGRGSVGMGEENFIMGSDDRLKSSANSLSMMCWKVAGWSKGEVFSSVKSVDRNNFRAKAIDYYNPDIVCLVETWLKENKEVEFDGFRWLDAGNRSH